MLAFVLCQSNPQIGIVPQITSIGDIDDNLRALNVKLNHNELTILNSIDEDDDY
jgi:aryl-alcohol dehydrogenase-like predicted oxidoreductase